MSLLFCLHKLNECGEVLPLRFLAHTIGLVPVDFADVLPTSLVVRSPSSLTLFPDIHGQFPQAAIESWFRDYFSEHQIDDWRDETFAIYPLLQRTLTPIGKLDRGILAYLGITGYGVHLNGYVRTSDGLSMWVAQRAKHKREAPKRWDQIAAGGVSYPLTPFLAMQKESQEEAGIDPKLSDYAYLGSELTYLHESKGVVRPDTIYCYDLRLPSEFVPVCNDGEVLNFALRPLADILYTIAETNDFKLNSAAVIIDFAIRHGAIDGEEADELRRLLAVGKRRIQHAMGNFQ